MSKERANSFKEIRTLREGVRVDTDAISAPVVVESEEEEATVESVSAQQISPDPTPTVQNLSSQATPMSPQPPVLALPSQTNQQTLPSSSVPRGRGRPANGKRSSKDWVGRTFYIMHETDRKVRRRLLELNEQGIALDKSELVDTLLTAWVKWQESGDSEFPIDEIPNWRNSENE